MVTLQHDLIEAIKNAEECQPINAGAVVEAYIKVGSEASKAKEILARNGFEIVDDVYIEADNYIVSRKLDRMFLPFGAFVHIRLGANDDEAGDIKNSVISSVTAVIYSCSQRK
jgi:hypothetical protein